MEPEVRVRVLGPLTVERNGEELTGACLGGARERRLLAILATAGGGVIGKDAVVDRLWDRPPRDPAASVDTALSVLRRALGAASAVVETHRPGYRLACRTDVAELGRLQSESRLEDALALAAADFLEGEPSTGWIDEQRRELARRRVDLLVGSGDAAGARGDDRRALERYAAAVAAEPLREDAHRGVLASLARSGRAAEALRAFEHCRHVLREELGISPAPETMALYERILTAQEPGPVVPHARSDVRELPFIGRRTELARLAAPARGCVVRAVLGEPGIGKSRLVQEATSAPRPGRLLSTKCFRLVTPVPYAVMAELAPDLVAGLPDTTSLPPAAGLTRLASKWEAELAGGPVTLVIDDLQCADEPSLTVLGLVLRHRPADTTVLVSARDGELRTEGAARRFLELVDGLGLCETITLGPLRLEELTASGFGPGDWSSSGGHPLLLTERARGGTDDELAELVLRRAVACGPAGTELLRAAAVMDRPTPLSQLADLAELHIADARTAAARLADAALLEQSGGAWHVRHDVLAELVRNELEPDVREGWHRHALRLLRSSRASPAELSHHAVAAADWQATLTHSLDAGDEALAAFANRDAADHYRRALEAVERGVGDADGMRRATIGSARALIVLGRPDGAQNLLDRLPAATGADEIERLLLGAECAWTAWRPSLAIPPARRALDLAEQLADPEMLERVHAFLSNPYGSLGLLDLAAEHVHIAIAIADRLGRSPPALLWYRLGLIQHHAGRERQSLTTLDRCREGAKAQHDERTAVLERIVRSWALGALGRYGEALAALDDARWIGRGEEVVARSRVPNTRASLLAELGLVDDALDADEESLEIARADGGPAVAEPQIQTLLNLAVDHLRLHHPDRAASYLSKAEALSVDAEYGRFRYLNRLHWVKGLLLLEAGDIDGALAAAADVSDMAQRYHAPKNEVRARVLRGQALGRRRRDADAALAELRTGARLAERLHFAALAESAHRLAATQAASSHHARRADQWRSQIARSVSGPLRDRLR